MLNTGMILQSMRSSREFPTLSNVFEYHLYVGHGGAGNRIFQASPPTKYLETPKGVFGFEGPPPPPSVGDVLKQSWEFAFPFGGESWGECWGEIWGEGWG